MNNLKCAQCGLVNFSTAEECRRCGVRLTPQTEAADEFVCATEFAETDAELETHKSRSILKRALVVVGMTASLLFGCYLSLLATSTPANYEQKLLVRRAIDVIEQKGFSREAFLLRHLTTYRTSDNWWNRSMGHDNAYAATNFPFEVVTLYPDFFNFATDDTERAAILLHEAQHLAGAGEEKTLESVWRGKSQLGWTRELYGQTRVWKNVNEFTRRDVPRLFSCGADGARDCAE